MFRTYVFRSISTTKDTEFFGGLKKARIMFTCHMQLYKWSFANYVYKNKWVGSQKSQLL